MTVSAKLNNNKFRNSRGVSLIEIIIVVAVLGILSAVAIPMTSSISQSTRDTKLVQDVRTINSAISTYLGSGGNLYGLTKAEQVISRLKQSQTEELRRVNAGFSGSTLDRRLAIRTVDEVSYSPENVVIWNTVDQRFRIVENSNHQDAIVEFVLEERATPDSDTNVDAEIRETALQFNGQDGWVWEYTDPSAQVRLEPTVIETTIPVPVDLTPDGPGITVNESTVVNASVGLNSAVNASFEADVDKTQATRVFRHVSGADAYYIDQGEVEGWQTTASDGLIEVWESGFNGVDAYEGAQFVEFNATQVSTLYQQVNTAGASSVQIFFAHGQRSRSTEQLRLLVGRVAPPTKANGNQVEDLIALGFEPVMETNTNNVGGWQTYSSDYSITDGAETLYFAFQSIGEFATQSVGNFLDEVSFQAVKPAEVTGLRVDLSGGNSTSNVITSGIVTLTGAKPGDELEIGDLPNNLRYTISTNPTAEEITIHITGTAPRWHYEAAFANVRFTTDSVDTSTRTLLFSANDGVAQSESASFDITL